MGKNQAHKMRQTASHGGGGGGDDDGARAPDGRSADGLVDASFHTAEWHAARLAALQVERPSWEDWKLRQKEADRAEAAALEAQEAAMREYRRGLEADRAARLGHGAGGGGAKKRRRDKDKGSKRKKDKDRKRRDKKRRREKKRGGKDKERRDKKRRRRGSDSSSGSSSSRSGGGSGSSGSDSDSSSSDPGGAAAKKGAGPQTMMKLSDYLNS